MLFVATNEGRVMSAVCDVCVSASGCMCMWLCECACQSVCEVCNLWTHWWHKPKMMNVDDTKCDNWISISLPSPNSCNLLQIIHQAASGWLTLKLLRMRIKHRLWSFWSWGFEEYFLFWKTSENMLHTKIVNLFIEACLFCFIILFFYFFFCIFICRCC